MCTFYVILRLMTTIIGQKSHEIEILVNAVWATDF